jgi:hypothetical protein
MQARGDFAWPEQRDVLSIRADHRALGSSK